MAASSPPGGEARLALTAGVGCYVIWGLVPLVFQAMGALGISHWEILANRCVWAAPMALLFVLAARQGRQAVAAFRNLKVLGWLALSAVLIAVNWMVYIWAVNVGRVLETSLGYYITPLLMMSAGAAFFREKIDRVGAVAIALAVVGVAIQTVAIGRLPWVSVALGLSFSGYGIVRKLVKADAQTGLLVETLILAAPGLAYILWLEGADLGHLTGGGAPSAWLLACGPITAIPLVLFAWAARRIPLTAIGFLQFIGPTIAFFIGLAQGEAFTPLRALSFAFIWGGAAVFLAAAVHRSRAAARAVIETAPAE